MRSQSDRPLTLGKLPPDLLASLLAGIPAGVDIVVGAQPGVDAAVVDSGDRYLVLAMDPVTLSAEPGRFAVQINANDIAVMGATPRWLLAALLLPPGSTADDAETIMRQIQQACAEVEVDLIGGHTEITDSVIRPVVAACMVGEVPPDRLVTSAGAVPGDALLLTRPIAIEGTAILAREAGETLRRSGVSNAVVEHAAALLDEPGISVVPAARAILTATLPHAMHDPTEGGILTAIRELAEASGVGVRVEAARIPILPCCSAICQALQLDPLGLLASGSLLAALNPGQVGAVRDALSVAGIESALIGTVVLADEGMMLVSAGSAEPLPRFERDELARWMGD